MSDDARILIVCTGNICRSPFIERLLQHELDRRRAGSDQAYVVRSAGTGAVVGAAMDPQAAAQLIRHGGDPSGFTARDLTPALIAEADLVLTATRSHRGRVALMAPKVLRRVFTFCDFADLVAGVDGPSAPLSQTDPSHTDPSHTDPSHTDPRHTDPSLTDPRSWVGRVTEEAAASRGRRPPLPPAAADIVDPYRRKDEVFVAMARQVVDSMPAVVRALAG
jgi:protein-tyrosine phosphatase